MLSTRITLLFESGMLGRMCLEHAVEELKQEGFRVVMANRNSVTSIPVEPSQCWLSFGSIAFIRAAQKHLPHTPLAYYSDVRFYLSHYAHRLPTAELLNPCGFYMPYGQFKHSLDFIERAFGGDSIFIRPDSGAKVFAGFSTTYADAQAQMKALEQVSSLVDHTMIFVAPARVIEDEYRCFIVRGEVVGSSRYSHDDQNYEPAPDEVLALANLIANLPWQIDIAYTCDIARVGGSYKVVELNAGSTSGFYGCNSTHVILRMIDAALLEFDGEISIIS